MTGRCVIVSGGEFSPVHGLREDDFVIACDRGYRWCKRLGREPDLLISDFDSYDGPVSPTVPLERHVPEKDDTDTMLAVRYAAEYGFTSILLCCALGGRLDHLVANLQTLQFAARHGLSPALQAEDTEVFVLSGSELPTPTVSPEDAAASASDAVAVPFPVPSSVGRSSLSLPRREGWSLSVFALDRPCRGVCIRGAKYPLEDAELLPSFPLGVSNEWASEQAEISVREGLLTVILSRLA